MAASTNLALRPFRNERLPWLMAGLLLAAAFATTFLHARLLGRLLSGDEANTVRAVRENEARIAELEDRISREPPLRIESAEAARLRALKELVDQRVFPWRRLLSDLEATLGDDVRLVRIQPAAARGVRGILVQLSGVARTKDAAFSLAETLDASEPFSSASLKSLSESDEGIEFTMDVVFDPANPAPGRPPSSAARSDSAAGAAP